MKKINKKQKNIMRWCGLFLFSVALVLSLNILFNKNKINDKYVGTWYIGYIYYADETKNSKIFEFIQEIYLFNDGTFFSKALKDNEEHKPNSVSGTYTIVDDSVVLKYEEGKKTKILKYNDGKLCATDSCDKYYTKNKLEKYYSVHNVKNEE